MVRLVAIVAVVAACGTAHVVEQTSVGGTLELSGDRGKAIDEANHEMDARCGPNKWTITQAGVERGEYLVHFQCNGAG
jgi:hypothetical protein